jgi:hypothetical protein
MEKTIDTLLNYLGQSSTWRGVILVAASFGIVFEPELQNHIIGAALGLVGIINILRNGGKK